MSSDSVFNKLLFDSKILLYAGPIGGEEEPALGIGDLIRVLCLAPNFAAGRLDWCSCRSLFPLVRDSEHIDTLYSKEQLSEIVLEYDLVINLTFRRLVGIKNVFELSDLIGSVEEVKVHTFDLVNKLAVALNIVSQIELPIIHPSSSESDYDIGFNWRVPSIWKTKELPQETWQQIEAILNSEYSITWQPETSDLEAYITWLRSSKLIISVVGLGCHLAMYYGVKLLMLSGPTDFAEAHECSFCKVLTPPSFCRDRPCYRDALAEPCLCMQDYIASGIADSAKELIASN